MRKFATIACYDIIKCGPDDLPKLLESYGIPITYNERPPITISYYDKEADANVVDTYSPKHPADWHIKCAHKIDKALVTDTILIVWDDEKPLGTEP